MEFEHSNPSSYFNAFLDIALYTNIYIHTHTLVFTSVTSFPSDFSFLMEKQNFYFAAGAST